MKQKILIFIDWYLPAYKAGGPVKSISNIIDSLKDNFDFDVFTSDRDFGDEEPFKNISFNCWQNYSDNVRVWYNHGALSYKFLYKLIQSGDYHKIYINSLFSIDFAIKPLLVSRTVGQDVVLAPRGMVGKGALSIKKLKKQVFISFFKFLLLDKYVKWHATSESEKNEIKHVFGNNSNITIAANISSTNINEKNNIEKKQNELKLCFISRISKKKNLLFALEVLSSVSRKISDSQTISFDIFGPIEDKEYWDKCLHEIDKNVSEKLRVAYKGELKPTEISSALIQYHFLLLPTLNENFGHIIAESFLSNTPVIISQYTPWIDLDRFKVGYDLELNQNAFENLIVSCIQMNTDEYESECRNGITAYVKSNPLLNSSIEQSLNLLQ